MSKDCILCCKDCDVNPLHFSVVPHKRGKKSEIHIKAQKKKKNVFLVVFNQQASVAWCKDFYRNL